MEACLTIEACRAGIPEARFESLKSNSRVNYTACSIVALSENISHAKCARQFDISTGVVLTFNWALLTFFVAIEPHSGLGFRLRPFDRLINPRLRCNAARRAIQQARQGGLKLHSQAAKGKRIAAGKTSGGCRELPRGSDCSLFWNGSM